MKMHIVGITDTGVIREENEDALLVDPRLNLLAVADGMGGYSNGAWCSNEAVTVIQEVMRQSKTKSSIGVVDRLRYAIGSAGIRIARRAAADESHMGTTVVAVVFEDVIAHVLHAGDSRAYLFRDGRLERVTTDHSFVAELVRAGVLTEEEARHHPQRNLITRALGQSEVVPLEYSIRDVRAGDVWLLCSDGLTGHVTDGEITVALLGESLEDGVERMVELANERGGTDNITVIAALIEEV